MYETDGVTSLMAVRDRTFLWFFCVVPSISTEAKWRVFCYIDEKRVYVSKHNIPI
jgi:hypothetical protein